jgi:hypothetical protein
MKKLILSLSFSLFASLIASNLFAQRPIREIHLTPRASNFKWVKAPAPVPVLDDAVVPQKIDYPSTGLRDVNETIIGSTVYDLQTNRSIGNRFLRNSDGTLCATWTTLCPGGISTFDRGTGYNYFDGSSWLPADCHKVEPTSRTGWPNIGVTSTGKEVLISHSSSNGGMLFTSRPSKGTGTWVENGSALGNDPNNTWARMVVGGANGNTIHALWNATGPNPIIVCGQIEPIVYSRSTNQGLSWTILNQCLDLIGADYYLGFTADDYAIASQGDNVAILVGDWTTDLILLKSTDNGTTWTKTIIWQFPIPFYDDNTMVLDTNQDGNADILSVPDGDGRVEFDKNGMLHVVFSKVNIIDDSPENLAGYYPDADGGLWYWNESMGSNPPVLIAAAEDLNGDGILNYPVSSGGHFGSGTYFSGLTLQPTIGFDEANNTYITYSTYDELADTLIFGAGHRHVYFISSTDEGQSWSVPVDVVPNIAQGGDGEYQEAVFACMASAVDDRVRIIYQRDPAPGTSLSANLEEAGWNTYISDIVYVESNLCAVDAPTGLSSDVLSSTKATLTWNAPAGASRYTIRYKNADSTWSVNSHSNSHLLNDLTPNTVYIWKVRAYCSSPNANASPWSEKATFQTDPIRIGQSEISSSPEAFPNPMSSEATISFHLENESKVKIELYSVDGRKIITVADGRFPSGENEVTLHRESMAAGVYLLRFITESDLFITRLEIE